MSSNNYLRFEPGYLGPGPAAYLLPTSIGYDFKKSADGRLMKIDRQIPYSFTIGSRYSRRIESVGPGPAPPETKLATKDGYAPVVTHYGPAAQVKYSIGRRVLRDDRESTPGPADYHIDASKQKELYAIIERKRRGPHFSIVSRPRKSKVDLNIPAPNQYFRSDKGIIQDGMDAIKRKPPAFSIVSRPNSYEAQSMSPGPANYYPQENRKRDGFSFGSTRSAFNRIDTIPGPNAYDTRPVKAITGRPGTAVSGKKTPMWTMAKRQFTVPLIVVGDNS